MSLKDSLFSDDAEEDLQHFLKSEQRKRVLVFPPVNNYRRFLIHQLVQERFADLQTFSIGQGFARRTVVCYKSDYIGPPKVNGVSSLTSNGFVSKSFSMGIENECTPNASPEHRLQKAKQAKSAPAYEIYRPPALRRGATERSPVSERNSVQAEQSPSDTSPNAARTNRPKRPDRAVYVPRHRRSVPDDESKTAVVQEFPSKPTAEMSTPVIRRPLDSKNILLEDLQGKTNTEIVSPKPRRRLDRHKFNQIQNCSVEKLVHITSSNEEVTDSSSSENLEDQIISKKSNGTSLERLEDSEILKASTQFNAVDFEKKENEMVLEETETVKSAAAPDKPEEILKETPTTKLVDNPDQKLPAEIPLLSVGDHKMDQQRTEFVDEKMDEEISDEAFSIYNEENIKEEFELDTASNISSLTNETLEKCAAENFSTSLKELDQTEEPQKLVDDVTATPSAVQTSDENMLIDVLNDNETVLLESKTCSTPEKINKEKINKPVKQTMVSKVLVISTCDDKKTEPAKPDPVPEIAPPEKKKVKKVEKPKSKPAPPPQPEVNKKINRDECDWDSLFDDNGDCLDPTLIEELTASVGEVVIEKPKSSYKSFTRPVEVSNDEYGHVIEIYNFPSDFKSSDLAAVFNPFKNGGFTLKWVDDTHCLGVFSSPIVAAEVLASDHPFVKTRPLSEATPLSRSKAQKSSEFLQPYRARPETCAALARRLVTKSLGVRLATARQEREQEKIVLREAKEKKRLANKQREDVWEGIIAEKST